MKYKLGKGSQSELVGVHSDLVKVTKRAIKITRQDFTVHDGLRTAAEQAEYLRTGVSELAFSTHQEQDDGFGHAVDLVPYINGRLRWEWPPIFLIAEAMSIAAEEFQVGLVWGGCWQRLDNDPRSPELMVEEYIAKRRRQGRRAFPDGPHYELA